MKFFWTPCLICILAFGGGNESQAFDLFDVFKKDNEKTVEAKDLTPMGTELQEIEMLTGEIPMAVTTPDLTVQTPRAPQMELVDDVDLNVEPNVESDVATMTDLPPVTDGGDVIDNDIVWATESENQNVIAEDYTIVQPQQSPDLIKIVGRKPMNIRVNQVVWAVAPAVDPVAKPAAENFAKTRVDIMRDDRMQKSYALNDPTASMAYDVQQTTETSLPSPAPVRVQYGAQQRAQSKMAEPIVVAQIAVAQTVMTDETPLYTEGDLNNALTPQAGEGGAAIAQPQSHVKTQPQPTPSRVAKGCPKLNILPEARSITYFAEDGTASMKARASIGEIRGGCEAVRGGLEVDLDILMNGRISNKGRFNGDRNSESFMTFPYFITVISPEGKIVDKKILATAMRFQPINDHLVHAEKITQFIPMDDVSRAHEYQLGVGYQLTRKQLAYNKAQTTLRTTNERASPDVQPAQRRSYNPLAGVNNAPRK